MLAKDDGSLKKQEGDKNYSWWDKHDKQ